MNRRKGVPCGCDADPCGCSPKNHCVKAISNVSPDPNGDFTIEAGENVTITETEYGIEISTAADVVKSVNGELPDQDGDVIIDTGVMTVNGVSPDADGDVTVDTGLMSIEVASEGTVLPDANGKIEILVGANMDIEVYPTLHQIGIMSTATALTKKSKTLTAANWNNNQLTLIEPEITTSSDIFVSPDPSDWSAYNAAGIRAVSQGTGTLTFECDTTPTSDIGVNLVIGRLNV